MIDLYQVKPGIRFDPDRLREMLRTMDQALFFAKLYKLDKEQTSGLVRLLFNSDLLTALLSEGNRHSQELQGYIVELGYEELIERGLVQMDPAPVPDSEILAQLFEAAQIEVAASIQEVADKLSDVIGHMPGKAGNMTMQSMMKFNAKRPIIGDHRATIQHGHEPDNLVIFDVSGSMSEETVRTIVSDVVSLSYMANAHLAIVSSTATWWGPGEFDVDSVLNRAEYAGTHYETLAPLFEGRQWGTVVTIADYDSSWYAKTAFKDLGKCANLVLDVSLVPMPTFLSEVIGMVAEEVRPLLVAEDYYSCM